MVSAEIFVLNYNGRDILAECLPSIIEAAKAAQHVCPVTVIDNRSTDDSIEFLKSRFPEVKVHLTEKNVVLCAFNEAVQGSNADVVFLLNNDLKADKGFVDPLLRVFDEHPDAFLAGPKTFTFDGKQYEGSLSKSYFRKGLFGAESRFPGFEEKINRAGFTMQSGFGAFRREFFLKLGGFDDLYLPGTVEDADFAYRAWKAGYAGYYEPKSLMFHKGQATFKRNFSRRRILAINQRNLYLFVWKNITDTRMRLSHFFWMPVRLAWFLLQGRVEFVWGFFWALGRLPQALRRRVELKKFKVFRTDREIFQIAGSI